MKNFDKFLEEIKLKGNAGLPGKDGKEYIDSVSNRAKQRLGINGITPRDPRVGQLLHELMGPGGLVERSKRICRGKEDELSELAETIIRNHYEAVLDGVELDIKIVSDGNAVKDFMDGEDGDEDEVPAMPEIEEIDDPEVMKHVHKAKLLNTVIQGEAKNTKHILEMPDVLEGLIDIFDDRTANELRRIWSRTTEIADKLDWIFADTEDDANGKAYAMKEAPQGLAGAVKVDWKKEGEDDKEDDDQEDGNTKNTNMDSLFSFLDDEDNLDKEDKEDIGDSISNTGTPIIKAVGVDFPMLLHETVKGIYELISSIAAPSEDASDEDKRLAALAKQNTTSFADEVEDFKYGPEIASDLRDFINDSPNVGKHPNTRDFVFGKMAALHPNDFLPLIKGILSKTDLARTKINSLINEVNKEFEDYQEALRKFNSDSALDQYSNVHDDDDEKRYQQEQDREDGYADPDNEEESDIDKLIKQSLYGKPEKEEKPVNKEYSKMTQAELLKARTQAENDEDYALAGRINSFMTKESRRLPFEYKMMVNESKRNKNQSR